MRILFSSFSFMVTIVIGAIAFAFTAIEFPTIMRDLIAYAQTLPAYLSGLGLNDRYLVWVDILLSGDKLVLLGFILAARIVLSIIASIVAPIFESGPRATYVREDDGSAFDGWGKSSR
jgi:hypothetical protein